MARYDKIFEALVKRAIGQSALDVDAFIEKALAAGMSEEALEERLIDDVENGGPLFGKFIRSLQGASASSVLAAERQGEDVSRARYNDLISMSEMDDILDDADPERLEEISEQLNDLDDRRLYTWIAELVNTCERCLPLHGLTLTKQEWDSRGFNPETIHEGWDSECHCELLEEELVEANRSELVSPLVRERVSSKTGLEGSKRTQRAVTQKDIDKALAAVERAKDSKVGRRTLRLMGQANEGILQIVKEGDE